MPKRVGILLFENFQILDAAGPLAAFEIAAHYAGGAYELVTYAAHDGWVESSSRAAMRARALTQAPPLDTLIVAGGDGARKAIHDADLLSFLRERASTTRRMASVCSGAFLLAQAGLLDGRRATTHWQRGPQFARTFPRVRLAPDRIYVRDGPIWTSAGITAGIDLALAMIAEDLGEEIARRTARQLVVSRRRAGGQSQFCELAEMKPRDGRFADLMIWAQARLAEPLNVERLAAEAAMSPRHFSRAFLRETGVTPARAVERLRLEAARARVETSAEPIELVAEKVGFGDPERMRRAFLRAFGHPPRAIRRAAQA